MRRLVSILVMALLVWASVPHAQELRYFYLAPVDGSGTDADPFHSRCLGLPGSGGIDLRPDPSVGTGFFVCASATLPDDRTGLVLLGSSARSPVTPLAKQALRQGLKLADLNELSGTTVDQVLPQLLIDLPRAKPGLWKELKQSNDGKYKIYLGEKVYEQTSWLYPYLQDEGLVADATQLLRNVWEPTLAWATILSTETFTGSDGDLDGRTFTYLWEEFAGSGWFLGSNQAKVNAGGNSEARAESALATADHYVKATIVSVSGAGTGAARCGPIARKDSSATRTYYQAYADAAPGGSPNYGLLKMVAAGRTVLATTTESVGSNIVVVVEPNGSTLTAYVDGVVKAGPLTDVSISSGTYGGLATSYSGTNVTCTADNWMGADGTFGALPPSDSSAMRRRSF